MDIKARGIGVFAYGEDTRTLRLVSELDALYGSNVAYRHKRYLARRADVSAGRNEAEQLLQSRVRAAIPRAYGIVVRILYFPARTKKAPLFAVLRSVTCVRFRCKTVCG